MDRIRILFVDDEAIVYSNWLKSGKMEKQS